MTEQQIDTLARGAVFQVCPDGVTRYRSEFERGYQLQQMIEFHDLSMQEEAELILRMRYHRGIDK